MDLLDEFDKKIKQSTEQIDKLLSEVDSMKSVDELLIKENSYHAENNRLLESVGETLSKLSSSLEGANETLNETANIVKLSDPSILSKSIDESRDSLSRDIKVHTEKMNGLFATVNDDIHRVRNDCNDSIATLKNKISGILYLSIGVNIVLLSALSAVIWFRLYGASL